MTNLRLALGILLLACAAWFGLGTLAGAFLIAVGQFSRPDLISLLFCAAMCAGFGLGAARVYRVVG